MCSMVLLVWYVGNPSTICNARLCGRILTKMAKNSMLSNNVSHERAVAGASVSPFGWNESTTMPNHDYAASGSQYVEPYGNNGYFNRTPHGPSTMTSPLTSVLALDAAVAQPTPGSPFYSSQPDTVSYHLNPEWTPPSMATATWQPPTFNNYAYQPAAIVSTGATAGTGWQVTQPFVNTQQHYYHGYRADHASGLSAFLAPHPTALSLDASSPVLGYMPVSADQHGHQQQQQSFMTVAPPPSQSSIPFLTESSVAEASPAVSPTASMASIVSSAAAVTAAETTTNGSPASMPAPSSSAMAIGGHPLADTAVEGSSTMAGGGAQDDDGNALGNAEAPLAANPVVAAGPAATTARGAAFRARQATLLAIALQRQRSAADAATQAAGQQQAPSLDEKLLLYRAQNMTYRDLHARLVSEGFNIAESTVRGRLRTLLIEKERRPRQPQWNRNQVMS